MDCPLCSLSVCDRRLISQWEFTEYRHFLTVPTVIVIVEQTFTQNNDYPLYFF